MNHARTAHRRATALSAVLATGALVLTATPGPAAGEQRARAPYTERTPVSRGYGGAVTTVDPEATAVGLRGAQAAAATRSTPPSPPRPRSASPSRSVPASAAAATSSTTTPRHGTGAPRSTAARPRPTSMTGDRVLDPGPASPSTSRTPDQRPVRRRARHAGHLADRARPVGHRSLASGSSSRPPGSRPAASSSTTPSASRPPTTRPRSTSSRHPRAVPARRRAARRRHPVHATPTSPRPTG